MKRKHLAVAAMVCGLIALDGYGRQIKQQASPMCDYEWVKDSPFWSKYFNCGTEAGGGSSGADAMPFPDLAKAPPTKKPEGVE